MSHINGFPLGYYDGGHIDTTTWKGEWCGKIQKNIKKKLSMLEESIKNCFYWHG